MIHVFPGPYLPAPTTTRTGFFLVSPGVIVVRFNQPPLQQKTHVGRFRDLPKSETLLRPYVVFVQACFYGLFGCLATIRPVLPTLTCSFCQSGRSYASLCRYFVVVGSRCLPETKASCLLNRGRPPCHKAPPPLRSCCHVPQESPRPVSPRECGPPFFFCFNRSGSGPLFLVPFCRPVV